jgi:hypothetical protein
VGSLKASLLSRAGENDLIRLYLTAKTSGNFSR